MEERRKNQRVNFHIHITFFGKNSEPIKGEVCDISLRGANVHSKKAADFRIGDIYRFLITLNPTDLEMKLEGDALIVRCEIGNKVGIRFVDIEVETLEHLRHIVALNFGDEDQIDDELKTFLR